MVWVRVREVCRVKFESEVRFRVRVSVRVEVYLGTLLFQTVAQR